MFPPGLARLCNNSLTNRVDGAHITMGILRGCLFRRKRTAGRGNHDQVDVQTYEIRRKLSKPIRALCLPRTDTQS